MNKINQNILLKVIISIITSIALVYYFQISTSNIMGIVFCTLIYCILGKIDSFSVKMEKRQKIITCFFSVFISICLVIGKIGTSDRSILDSLLQYEETIIKDANTANIQYSAYQSLADKLVLSVCLIGIAVCIYILLIAFINGLKNRSFIDEDLQVKKTFPVILFVFIFVCWIPYFLINYPGILSFDSVYQISQVEGQVALNSHHPVAHTLLIGVFYNLGKNIFGSSNAGVALYTVLQMLILDCVYTYSIYVLRKLGLKKYICYALACFFGLVPFNAMYAITMWKDILFASFVLWFSIILYVIKQDEVLTYKRMSQFILSGLLVMLFRTNGAIVFIFCIPVVLLIYKKKLKKIILCLALILICYFVITGPIYNLFEVEKVDDITESISIPMQQIARVVIDKREELSEYDIQLIEAVAPIEKIESSYNCRFSDPIKVLVRSYGGGQVIEKQKYEYIKLWIEFAVKYPLEYLKAEIDATLGYWYPDEQYTTIFLGVYPNEFGIYTVIDQSSKTYLNLYAWCNLYRKVPLLGNLYSLGTMFVLLVMCIYYSTMHKNKRLIIMECPCLFVWATVMIATPLHSEMRYVYSLMVTVPIILATLLIESGGRNK